MKLSKLLYPLILVAFLLFLSGASENEEVGPNLSKEIRADEHKARPKEIKKPAQKQPEKSTSFQTEILETLRPVKDQIKTTSKQYDTNQKSWDSPSMLVQIALVIVGIGYTIFAAFQWYATRKLADLERPWIAVRSPDIDYNFFDDPGTFPFPIEVSWEVVNVGRSPAFVISICRTLGCWPLANIPKTPSYIDGPLVGEKLIPPNSTYENTTRIGVSEDDIQGIKKETTCIMFYGCIEYYDTTRRNVHKTRFCYRWYLQGGQIMLDSVRPRNYIEYT